MQSLDSSICGWLSQLDSLQSEVHQQRDILATMSSRLDQHSIDSSALGSLQGQMAHSTQRLSRLAEGVQSSLRNVESMHAGLQEHRTHIVGLQHGQISTDRDLSRVQAMVQDSALTVGAMQEDLGRHTARMDDVHEGLSDHTHHIEQLHEGLVHHTEHLSQMREGLLDHSKNIGELGAGMGDHTAHLRQMKAGLQQHTSTIDGLAAPQPSRSIDSLLADISNMKARVDDWDRTVVTGGQPRDCTARELSQIMLERAR